LISCASTYAPIFAKLGEFGYKTIVLPCTTKVVDLIERTEFAETGFGLLGRWGFRFYLRDLTMLTSLFLAVAGRCKSLNASIALCRGRNTIAVDFETEVVCAERPSVEVLDQVELIVANWKSDR
jgi:hypothetical protein